jgi:hypothetical protein
MHFSEQLSNNTYASQSDLRKIVTLITVGCVTRLRRFCPKTLTRLGWVVVGKPNIWLALLGYAEPQPNLRFSKTYAVLGCVTL